MQGKFFDNLFLENFNVEKVENIKQIYEWAQAHTELCHCYIQELDINKKIDLKEKIDFSLGRGKTLMEMICLEQLHNQKFPKIPLSGMNRFSSSLPKHETMPKPTNENISKNLSLSIKSELGSVTNIKKVPMPSRTYLKNKK